MLTNCEISIKNKFIVKPEQLEDIKLTNLGSAFFTKKFGQVDIFLPIPINVEGKSYVTQSEWLKKNEKELDNIFTMQEGDIIIINKTGEEFIITNLAEKSFGTETMRHWYIICK